MTTSFSIRDGLHRFPSAVSQVARGKTATLIRGTGPFPVERLWLLLRSGDGKLEPVDVVNRSIP